jgi:hypothetical protein
MIAVFVALAVAGGFILMAFVAIRRRRRDLRPYLEPALRACGVEFLSARAAPPFHTGPFPKIDVEVGRPISNVGGVSGEYWEYKIVKIRLADGSIREVWACVEFEVFRFRRTRWRAESKDGLPAPLLAMLEK